MPDQDWTKPKPLNDPYSGVDSKDTDSITVTRGFIMWLLREVSRLSAQVQAVELENIRLKSQHDNEP